MLGSHEGDLLRLHLNATAAHVAAWIVVEASFTLSGLPRTPDGALMASLRAQYGPKLVHAIERELPCRGSLCKGLSPHDAAFENEAYQRDQCARHVHRAGSCLGRSRLARAIWPRTFMVRETKKVCRGRHCTAANTRESPTGWPLPNLKLGACGHRSGGRTLAWHSLRPSGYEQSCTLVSDQQSHVARSWLALLAVGFTMAEPKA